MSKRLSLEELNLLVGTNNGKVEVLKYMGRIKSYHYYEVKCLLCGKVWNMYKGAIKRGQGCQSCSNFNNDYDEIRIKYDLTADDTHSLVQHYGNMMSRCYNTNYSNYHNYGGRGITVCNEWRNSKASYMNDLLSIGWNNSSKLQIDRIDNDGNYSPNNIRLVSSTANNLNRRITSKHPFVYEKHNKKTNTFQVRITKIGYVRCFKTLAEAIKARDKLIVEHKLVDCYSLL